MNECNSVAKPQSPLLIIQYSLSCLLPCYFEEHFHHQNTRYAINRQPWIFLGPTVCLSLTSKYIHLDMHYYILTLTTRLNVEFNITIIFCSIFICLKLDFPGGSVVKNCLSVQKTWAHSLIWADPLGKEIATHSSILAWECPWREEPGRLQYMGLQKSRT